MNEGVSSIEDSSKKDIKNAVDFDALYVIRFNNTTPIIMGVVLF